MATLDVTNIVAVEFQVASIVTAPVGGTYGVAAGARYAIPVGQTQMTIDVAGDVNCMTRSGNRTADNIILQVFCVDEVRSAV